MFFYDVLIELSKYYLIHKIVEDEYNLNNDKVIYNNIEEVIECKTETLIKYLYMQLMKFKKSIFDKF